MATRRPFRTSTGTLLIDKFHYLCILIGTIFHHAIGNSIITGDFIFT
ncbi:MAG: hypothetical protein QXZ44_07055 [Ferroplasma sp.]